MINSPEYLKALLDAYKNQLKTIQDYVKGKPSHIKGFYKKNIDLLKEQIKNLSHDKK